MQIFENKVNELNGIRGLACLVVLVTHAIFIESAIYISGIGKIGGWLFLY